MSKTQFYRPLYKVFLLILLFMFLFPFQIFSLILNLPSKKLIPMIFHKIVLIILDIKISKYGKITSQESVLLAGNHVSYLDIVILGCMAPLSFIAKKEISDWPIFGFLAKLQRTIFIERKALRVGMYTNLVSERLKSKEILVLFPEGTTSDGNRVLPFKSSLFSVFEQNKVSKKIQTFTICYAGFSGLPMGRRNRPLVAWFGNMTLIKHLWNLMSLANLNVIIIFHNPSFILDMNRKQIALMARKQVAEGLDLAFGNVVDKTKNFYINI